MTRRISDLSTLTHRIQGAGEIFEHTDLGFSAAWDGRPESGRGMLLSLGRIDTMRLETAAVDRELQDCWLGVTPPKVSKSWYHDTKKDTTGTGGAERRYVDPSFARAAHLKEVEALYALISWNCEQLSRPWSAVPWPYDESGRFAGRSHGAKLNGWNAVDPAHASRTRSMALALLGHPLGLMNAWMEFRFLFNDSFRGNPLDQPRCAWLLRWARWAIELGFDRGDPGLLEDFFRWPRKDPAKPGDQPFDPAVVAMAADNPIRAWSEWLVRSWVEQYARNFPEDKAGAGLDTDPKVMPQLKGTPYFAGYYTWQYGLALWCFHRHGDERLADLADTVVRPLVDHFKGDGMVTWPYSRGTDPFVSEDALLALILQVPLEDRPNMSVWPRGLSWRAVKSWKSYGDELVALIAPGLTMAVGPDHSIPQNIAEHRSQTAHWDYCAPFWRDVS